MIIFLVRHASTYANETRILEGHSQGALSIDGLKQARVLGAFLSEKCVNPSMIYTSDLLRSTQTAAHISSYFPNVPVIQAKELRERFLGGLEGKTYEYAKIHGDCPDTEPTLSAGRKMFSFFQKEKLLFPRDSKIIAISHGMIINSFLAHLAGHEDPRAIPFQKNTGINIIRWIDEGIDVLEAGVLPPQTHHI